VLLLVFVLASFLIIINLFPFLNKKKEKSRAEEEVVTGDLAGNTPKEDLYNTHEYALRQEPEPGKPDPEDDFEPVAPIIPNKTVPDKDVELTIEETPLEIAGSQKGTVTGSLDTPYDPTLDYLTTATPRSTCFRLPL